MPHRRGAAELGLRRDLQVDAQRVAVPCASRRPPVDARAGSSRTRPARRRWPVGVRVGRARRRARRTAGRSPRRRGGPPAVRGSRRPARCRRSRRPPRCRSTRYVVGRGVFGEPAHDDAVVDRRVGDQSQRAGQHHLVQTGAGVAQPFQRRGDAGAVHRRARAASRRCAPAGSVRGRPVRAALGEANAGRAASAQSARSTSKGNAPSTIGVDHRRPGRPARRRAAGRRVSMPSATTTPSRPARTKEGSPSLGRHGLTMAGQAERADLATPCSNPQTAIDAAAIDEPDALGQRQLDPPGDAPTGRSGRARRTPRRATRMCSSAIGDGTVGAVADLRDALAARAAVRPDQPVGHRLADLGGGQCPRSRRNPIRPAAGTPRRPSGRRVRR